MTHTIKVDPSGKSVSIVNLAVSNPDFFSVVATQAESKREQTVLDIIAVGSAAMRRVQTTIDVDFVGKRFAELTLKFNQSLDGIERKIREEVSKRFSPTESGSYVKAVGDLVKSAKEELTTKDRELHALLDPEKKNSAVGRLAELIEEATAQFEQMFDPDAKGSYAAQLNEKLTELFGGNGRTGVLNTSLSEALQPVLRELRELKEKMEARKAAEQVIATSSLKGRPFEELVQVRLSYLAQPFGDDIAAVGSGNGGSRAGDFVLTINGSGKRVVVEARDRKQMSLPAIKLDLEREMKERAADVAVYVSSGLDMLPQHVGNFQIYGDKLVTTLDNLPIAYRVARVMALMEAPEGEVDISALRAVLGKIRDAAHSLRNVRTKVSQIEKFADGIRTDASGAERAILDLVLEGETLLGVQHTN